MKNSFAPLTFSCGLSMKNRFMLAPLTNMQSHDNGLLSSDEHHWLSLRAKGGFGSTVTAAAHVQPVGQGFRGQMGIFSDAHIPRLAALAEALNAEQSLSIVQLHHGGLRADKVLNGGDLVAPSADEKTGARAMTHAEVLQAIEDFISAAQRAQKAGFDGVELHGAHNYLLCQFLSADYNRRDDEFGGSLANRSRILFDIIRGIRKRCGKEFLLGVRLTPERNGILLDEAVATAKHLFADAKIDFLDMSLWDVFKTPVEEQHQARPLLSYFTELERGEVRLGVAGKLYNGAAVAACMAEDVDFMLIGKAAILHHDFPQLIQADPSFEPVAKPVSRDYLRKEGLGEAFIEYMNTWPGFVA